MGSFEDIDNQRLIYNGLEHVEFELARQSTSYFRVARETHQILYRSLVEALKGTANIAVTGKPMGTREHRYQFDDGPIKEIHKESVRGCTVAWRFSEPVIVDAFLATGAVKAPNRWNDFLIPFFDALAMIQTDLVHQFVNSHRVSFTDEEMKLMEWLYLDIRNEYEHFLPKGYSAQIGSLLRASEVAVSKARSCLFDTNNVLFFSHSIEREMIRNEFDKVLGLIVGTSPR